MVRRLINGKWVYPQPNLQYYSRRYNKWVAVYTTDKPSDGATGAIDICSNSWRIHDKLCDTGVWEDGTKVTNWQASMVIYDILEQEGRHIRKHYWKWATFLFGGGECRKNGMLNLRSSNAT
jgi:hypothetical protein